MFWVISVYFNVRNILPESGTFPPGHSVYYKMIHGPYDVNVIFKRSQHIAYRENSSNVQVTTWV